MKTNLSWPQSEISTPCCYIPILLWDLLQELKLEQTFYDLNDLLFKRESCQLEDLLHVFSEDMTEF